MKKVIKTMFQNRKINNGLPLVALSFSDAKNRETFIFESNLNRRENSNLKLYETHAEWVLITKNSLDKENTKDKTLIITTTPCDKCAKKLSDETSFKNIFYLTEKYEDDSKLWKTLPGIKKYIPQGAEQAKLVKKMISHWEIANLENRKKTIKRKKLQ